MKSLNILNRVTIFGLMFAMASTALAHDLTPITDSRLRVESCGFWI